ncbi:hypothetical protein O181_024772 [Austropuccinia psidii MF-1]|uniref:Methyltransferase type 11 domain-containing protein n=1 Tax=Austropuccinia psidii MF-1 TaxID=1389203 RepID=A0A9Q3CM59_9BASI|nr:hypothetical protein [Austropuccinia psidii MF-1]
MASWTPIPHKITSRSLSSMHIFDRQAKLKQKARVIETDTEKSRLTDYLRQEVACALVDRLVDIRRKFSEVVEFGAGAGSLVKELTEYGLDRIILTDSSKEMLWRDHALDPPGVAIDRVVMDEESVRFERSSQDCIMSCLSLHWVNDLPGTLTQINHSLKPDGVFIGAILGGDTLFELRTSLQLAEQERQGGISPHISPMTDSRSMSSLINRAGFSIPTIDNDELTVRYPSMFELMDDLKFMGESNAIINRPTYLRRDTLLAASSIYKSMYGSPTEPGIPATFQIIYFIGWKADSSQPKPMERGSAQHSLKELGTTSDL